MDELLQAPNSWPFRDSAVPKGGSAKHGTLDRVRAKLVSRSYANALEWATEVRQLLSYFIPKQENSDLGSVIPNLGAAALKKDTVGDEQYTDR